MCCHASIPQSPQLNPPSENQDDQSHSYRCSFRLRAATPRVGVAPRLGAAAAPVPPAAPAGPGVPPLIAITPAPSLGWRSRFDQAFSGITSNPPESWAQTDPADSLYRLARTALNRGEYRRAADLFGQIGQKFPNSVYASDARYWRAFALYRIGGQDDLRVAL